MLQQKRVETVTPYFERCAALSDGAGAAEAPLDDVLTHWAGSAITRRAQSACGGARSGDGVRGEIPADGGAAARAQGVGAYTAGRSQHRVRRGGAIRRRQRGARVGRLMRSTAPPTTPT